MNFLSDCITYVRRIVKAPSNAQLTDNLIIDFINRFYTVDVSARMELFDLKTRYTFETTPGVIDYNMPVYQVNASPGPMPISSYPIYQGFFGPVGINGIEVAFTTQRESTFRSLPLYVQPLQTVATGDGITTTFTLNLPYFPAIPGHIDMQGMILANRTNDPIFTGSFIETVPVTSVQSRVFITYTNSYGANVTMQDSGQFLNSSTDSNIYGLMMVGGLTSGNCVALNPGYSMTQNTICYNNGILNITFPTAPPAGTPIQAQCYFYNQGIPRSCQYYNNTLTLLPPAFTQYVVELGAYLTPAAFLSSNAAIPFGYMTEYIARGAARKIMSDTGDTEQLMFYEPFFREQELLVWKRSQRIFTSTRTATIFGGPDGNIGLNNNFGVGNNT